MSRIDIQQFPVRRVEQAEERSGKHIGAAVMRGNVILRQVDGVF